MSIEYVRRAYGVPAHRGGEVIYSGGLTPIRGVIKGAENGRLRLRFPGNESHNGVYHPTWKIEYVEKGKKK